MVFHERDRPVETPGSAIGHVRNLPLAPERPEGWGLHHSAVDELWFVDRAAAVAAAGQVRWPGCRMVIGRDVELYRR